MARRVYVVRRNQGQWPLRRFLQVALGEKAARVLPRTTVLVNGRACPDLGRRLKPGDEVQVETRAARPVDRRGDRKTERPALKSKRAGERPRNCRGAGDRPRLEIVYVDDDIVVVNKPAGLTTVRHRDEMEEAGERARFLPPTLVDMLPPLLPSGRGKRRVRAVHRLDRDTTGLVVLALNAEAETALGQQFRAHTIERRYLALVRGEAKEARIESHLVRDRGDGRRGSGSASGGQRAVTQVRVLERLGPLTLVECELETGRTHQVRIHLGEQGTPLCGERIYDRPPHGKPLPDPSNARRPLLHAAVLAIDHPTTGKRMRWRSELPEDMSAQIL